MTGTRNFILGGFLSLLLLSVGLFWWQGRAQVEEAAPPPAAALPTPGPEELPIADPGTLRGPSPPEAGNNAFASSSVWSEKNRRGAGVSSGSPQP